VFGAGEMAARAVVGVGRDVCRREQVGSVPGTRLACRSLSLSKEDIMVKQNHGIVQDERGQDQPASKKAAHRSEPTVPKDAYELDPRDVREGVYDPVNDEGKPQPDKSR
jgi:hypothetical protein